MKAAYAKVKLGESSMRIVKWTGLRAAGWAKAGLDLPYPLLLIAAPWSCRKRQRRNL
jgi:hypothetical protein